LGFQEHWFGYLFSATFAFGIFIPYFTKPLIKKIGGYKKYLMAVLSLMFLLLFLIGFINSFVFVIVIYILFMSMYDFYGPVREIFFQKFVPGKMRATIGSFKNMITALAVIIAYPLVGFVADKIGPQYTIFIGAFILIPVIILYSKIKE
jgi:MFS family permease